MKCEAATTFQLWSAICSGVLDLLLRRKKPFSVTVSEGKWETRCFISCSILKGEFYMKWEADSKCTKMSAKGSRLCWKWVLQGTGGPRQFWKWFVWAHPNQFSEIKAFLGNPAPCSKLKGLFTNRVPAERLGFPGGASGKEPACQSRRLRRCGFNPWVRKIPWRRKWQPTPVFLPGESLGQRSLVGYNPRGCKESNTTERLSTLSEVRELTA